MRLSVTVSADVFDLGQEEARLAAEAGDAGAVVAFVGRVRGQDGPVALASLFLEHYPGVTESEIARIAREAATRWPLLACRVVHRVGHLRPGEGIVLVLMASSHRQAAFQAAEYLMDYLKTQAPFWKRECFADGSERWVEAKTSDDDACRRWS
ncbi:MAG: molybdenum cofactor biosynthesis protein MoaE [Paludibacterium sp.]|uniref:molybdenum cofactor biosynthesis protein MoaE n=1 Tax=Paludibacterium sp. TaxID=1917523 RepID=UPI0025F54EC2|nr:molybdenum cofactor biosynthesis protein MoaE [Paludibacterium sp.]MBV8047057.1 molybdenum cofactor biosynthesis protein MoaE [Paludibacterium sp.]MBV8646415.1 molybdenum cofactor biosynthesis protein MoaE [Paludibacterium sp.]